jgi:hypothetical protein
VPNLNADRSFWVTVLGGRLNVRRLMYQTLIWPAVLRDNACRLIAPLHAKRGERLADALVDGVRRNLQLGGDLFGGEELVDEAQTIELARRQARYTPCDDILMRWAVCTVGGVRHARRLLQSQTPA